MRLRFLLVLLLLAAVAPAGRPAFAQSAGAATAVRHEAGTLPHSEVDEIYERFSRAYDTLDARALASLYGEGALYLAPDSDVLRGRAAIGESFSRFFEQVRGNGGKVAISFRIVDRTVAPDMVCDVGYFELTSTREGKSQKNTGKLTVVSRRQDGQWRIHVDSYSGVPGEKPAAPESPGPGPA